MRVNYTTNSSHYYLLFVPISQRQPVNHSTTANFSSTLPLPILQPLYHCQFFIYSTTTNSSSTLPLPILYPLYHSQFFIYSTTANSLSTLPLPILYPLYHSQFFIYSTTANSLSTLPLPILHLLYHYQFFTNSTPRTLFCFFNMALHKNPTLNFIFFKKKKEKSGQLEETLRTYSREVVREKNRSLENSCLMRDNFLLLLVLT